MRASAKLDDVMLMPVKRPTNAGKEAFECGVRAGANTRRREAVGGRGGGSTITYAYVCLRMLTYAHVC